MAYLSRRGQKFGRDYDVASAGRLRPLDRRCVAILILVISLTGWISTATAFQVTGTVRDEVGKPLPHVGITIEGPVLTPQAVTVFSDRQGRYQFPSLSLSKKAGKTPRDVDADLGLKSITIRAFRLGYQQKSPAWQYLSGRHFDLGDAKGHTITVDFTMAPTDNIASQAPASAWFHGVPHDQAAKVTTQVCSQCHQLAASHVRDFASALDGLSIEEKEQAWRDMVQWMRVKTLEMGPPERIHLRWGLEYDTPQYNKLLEKEHSLFDEFEETTSAQWLARHMPTRFDKLRPFKLSVPYITTGKTTIREFQLPTIGWTREAAMAPGSDAYWVVELDKDRIGRVIPGDGSVLWYDVPGEGRQGPHTINADEEGNIWVALEESYSLGRFNPKTEKWDIWSLQKEYAITHDMATNPNRRIRFDKQGRVWMTVIGTNELMSLDPKSGKLETFTVPKPENETDFHTLLYGAVMTSDGRHVWFSQVNGGYVGAFNTETHRVDILRRFDVGEGPRRMAIDEQDRLWIPLYGGGQLVALDGRTGKEIGRYDLPDRRSAPYSATWDPARQVVWLTTTNADALYRFDPETRTFGYLPLPREKAFFRMLEIDHSTGNLVSSYANLPVGKGPNMVVVIEPGDKVMSAPHQARTNLGPTDQEVKSRQ